MSEKGSISTTKPWQASVLTLFPDAFPGILGQSIIGTARSNDIWSLKTVDIRDFADNKHRNVDDTPAGGGPGMVIKPNIAAAAIDSVAREGRPVIYLTPRGKPLTQQRVRELAAGPGAIIFCGRFEGLDQRVIEGREMEEISIGDFVLAGGEVASMALLEACIRLLPGVLGDAASAEQESFENGLLEHPLYTRPREWEGREIPPVLLSGDHKKIAQWQLTQAEKITKARRPDLYHAYKAIGDDHERD
ncbi:MAG: tRNA (guanosine(37)-N1)-methyltransferase TrmD [Hellea sp.]|nr:tRNA (guanosine(37)-N1)-methyltransferase TrmD [Hellea sp.]